jgi:signal transduction histidine kinase
MSTDLDASGRNPVSRFFSWLINHSFLMGRFFQRPSGRELLACFAAATIIGIFLGLLFGILALLKLPESYFAGPWTRLLDPIGRAVLQLVVFSTAFYLLCGIPAVTITPRTLELAPAVGKWVRGGIYFVGGSLAMTIGLFLMPAITGLQLFSGKVMAFIIAVDGIITTIVGAIIFSYKRMELQVRRNLEALAEKDREAAEMQRLVDTSRFSALQAQINPHFFFNTLNSITALIPHNPDLAAGTIERLADLFRYTLKASEEALVPFSEEIEFVQAYLDIEKLRFGDRLRVNKEIEKSCLDWPVPGLILQPLVENAIRHGIAKKTKGGSLTIGAGIDNGRLRILVSDNGPGFAETDPIRPGHALGNIRNRLRLLYKDRASFEAGRNTLSGETEMILRIPTEKKD